MTALTAALMTISLLVGLVAGMMLHYIIEYKPLALKHNDLINTMVGMKKQGFVPQFSIEQIRPLDISEGVTEY